MVITGRSADKLIFAALYTLAAIIVVWGAGRITDKAADMRLYRDFLLPWETRVVALRYQNVSWPKFEKNNPAKSMQALIALMQMHGLDPPESNTGRRFVYRLRKFGGSAYQLLLVYHDHRLIIYGLPDKSFIQLDLLIDGIKDPGGGDFTGEWSTDGLTRIGIWRI